MRWVDDRRLDKKCVPGGCAAAWVDGLLREPASGACRIIDGSGVCCQYNESCVDMAII